MAIKRFPVEASHILMFARALGDPNPVYAEEEAAARSEVGGIIAPPTFIQAGAQFDPDYPLRPRPGQKWFGSGREPSGLSAEDRGEAGGWLHGEQEYTYHRHPRPGDVLTTEVKPGRTWEREGRRGGKLTFRETITEYRDQEGTPVITARSVAVRPEKVVEQD